MAMPMSRGREDSKVMAPVTERACTIPTAAEADCKMPVNSAPARMPRMGLERVARVSVNQGCLPRSETALLITLMPNISTVKPMRISPRWCCSFFLENTRRNTPMIATIPVRVAVESRLSTPELPSM